ncbi:MAG: AcrB/AcrD/AcrF family protein, partial [Gammaproteobacteria bacterium]
MDNSKNKHDLGLAGNLTQTFMHSPLTLLLIIATFAIGSAGFIMTPRQEDPQISVPMVDIFVSYPGASTEQVASLVADPLERIMSEIPGVDHVYSASQRDQAMVTVQFEVGEEMGPSLVKLYDKLESNVDKIPPGVSPPLVKPKGVDDVPMVALTLWSDSLDDSALRLIALDVMQELKEIPETSQSFVISGRQEQLRIEVKPERLAGYGITMEQIAGTVMTANSERTVGSIESGDNSFQLYTGAFLKNSEDVERLLVAMHDGNPVYVRDVAEVIHGPGEAHKFVNFYTGPATTENKAANGVPAVTLAIAKKAGTNGVSVVEDVLSRIDSMKGRLIPGNVEISVTRNYGKSAQDKVNGLMFKLVLVTVAVSILIFWFLNWRAALVCFIVIPNVILVTTFAALIMGYTIDRVSLFALIFSIGILVDDAIVVVENMYRRWAMDGEISDSTSIDAVREVGNPTILATFTVIAALLPMGMVRGMMGPYMEPIPALGSVAMLYSLFAAFAFTPYLAIRFKPAMDALHKMEESEHNTVKRLDGFYRSILNPLMDNKLIGNGFLISLFVIFFLCCSLFYFKAVKVKMMPLDNKSVFNVVINFPEGTSLPITANLTRQFAEEVRKVSEVTAIQSYVGTASPFDFNGLVRHYYLRQQPWQADLNVQLLHKKERDRTSHEIALEVREILTELVAKKVKAGIYTPLSKPKFQIVEMPPGPPVLQTMVAEVYGPTAHERHEVAMKLTELFKQASTITDVDNYIQKPYEIWNFRVNREKAIRAGVSVDAINNALEMAMGGFVLGDIKDGSILEATMIVLQVPLNIRANFNYLSQLPVPNMQGSSVPLSELGAFIKGHKEPVIYHKDLRDVEYVIGEVIGELASPIYAIFEVGDMLKLEENFGPRKEQLSGTLMEPPDPGDMHQFSGFEWTGEWTVTYETFRDMGLAFAIAIILIYMLVVWEFGNFILPAVIISPIPLTLVGIIPGHALMGSEFTATSMIGFIALAGIIVRNSILLVDYSRQEISRGVEIKEAIIMACITRTRPIVITALALVVGSTAILMDPIFQGMAVSLMFGVFVSTILTLIVIPLGCYSARDAFCDVMREDHPDYQLCVEERETLKKKKSSS